MLDTHLKKPIIRIIVIVSIFLAFALSINLVSADGGSIAILKTYPEEEGAYIVINHIIYQTTAVNTNTTVSVIIDDGSPIPMTVQNITNEVDNNGTVADFSYTWQITVPAITSPGRHTIQFFSHYYVWQETDQYWAEFNGYTNEYSFTIAGPCLIPSPLPPQTITSLNFIITLAIGLLAALSLLPSFVIRKRS